MSIIKNKNKYIYHGLFFFLRLFLSNGLHYHALKMLSAADRRLGFQDTESWCTFIMDSRASDHWSTKGKSSCFLKGQ